MIIAASCQQKELADLVVTNARIYTVDSAFTTFEAMAVKDGAIIALGTSGEVLSKFESDRLIDAEGNCIYPGFIDGHCHYYGYAQNHYRYAEFRGTRSFEEILTLLEPFRSRPAGSWVLGRGWDQNDWPDKSYPDNTMLNELFPDKPVVLIRIDGHAILANDLALQIANISATTKIEGGQVMLRNGRMTGILIDNAADSLKEAIPELTQAETWEALAAAEKDLFQVGLTGVGDAGLKYETVKLMDEMHQSGELKIRVYAMLEPGDENLANFVYQGPYLTDRLNVRSVKLYADGALGSRGALLLGPYADEEGHHGLKINSDDYYRKWMKDAFDHGYQVNTHCIGDSANRFILDLYGEFLQGPNDRRWRIEHAQVVHPSDLVKFKDFGIIPSIQSTHCTSDMYWAGDRLGEERLKNAYAFKALLEQNGWLVNGTDFPVEETNPLLTFYAAVSRKDLEGYPEGGFQTEDALSRIEALRSITIWPAWGSFDEDRLGSLEVGKKADFVILDRDLMEVPVEHIPGAMVIKTVLNGEVVYER